MPFSVVNLSSYDALWFTPQEIYPYSIKGTKMDRIERIGVSLDKKLLSMFDGLIAKQGYQSRSEAIRDLVRRQLSEERLGDPKA